MACIINAESGTGLTNSADGSGLLKLQSAGKTTNALAWVNFNGTGTVAIRSSYNVSSITDNGTCDYTINFTIALSDVNYSIVGGTTGTGISASTYPQSIAAKRQTDMLTTSCRIWALTGASSGTLSISDAEVVNVAVFGN